MANPPRRVLTSRTVEELLLSSMENDEIDKKEYYSPKMNIVALVQPSNLLAGSDEPDDVIDVYISSP